MSKPREYTVMGEDGKEYGPVSAAEVRQWVAEGRLEKKSPIKPSDARDWVFLGELPEFSDLFPVTGARPPRSPINRRLIVTGVIVLIATITYYLLHHFKVL